MAKVLFGLLNPAVAFRHDAQAKATLRCPGAIGRNFGEPESEPFEAFQCRLIGPIREPDLWASRPVCDALVSVLAFLSEDEYAFEFVPLAGDASLAGHIDFDDTPFTGVVDAVQLFSGGAHPCRPTGRRISTRPWPWSSERRPTRWPAAA